MAPASAAGGQRVTAVVVTYQPDADRLRALLEALNDRVALTVVVDNASTALPACLAAAQPGVELVRLGDNQGIAAAQNVGIERGLQRGSDFILLLDQDSLPAPDMLDRLVEAADALARAGHRVGAVGPALHGDGVATNFVRFAWFRYRQIRSAVERPWVICDLLIASGCLVAREALERVGPMDEGLFIDKVDTEWCLRATSHGFVLAGVPSAVLHHRLGERTLRVWWGRWRELPAHRPFRYYYIVRNSILLWRRPYAGWRWRTGDIKQCAQIALFFGVLSAARRDNLPMVLRGLRDGILGRTGRLPRAAHDR